jgi:hypothetical protein
MAGKFTVISGTGGRGPWASRRGVAVANNMNRRVNPASILSKPGEQGQQIRMQRQTRDRRRDKRMKIPCIWVNLKDEGASTGARPVGAGRKPGNADPVGSSSRPLSGIKMGDK